MRGAVVEQTHVVERTEDADSNKKKKRRSNRRSKQNSSVSGTLFRVHRCVLLYVKLIWYVV